MSVWCVGICVKRFIIVERGFAPLSVSERHGPSQQVVLRPSLRLPPLHRPPPLTPPRPCTAAPPTAPTPPTSPHRRLTTPFPPPTPLHWCPPPTPTTPFHCRSSHTVQHTTHTIPTTSRPLPPRPDYSFRMNRHVRGSQRVGWRAEPTSGDTHFWKKLSYVVWAAERGGAWRGSGRAGRAMQTSHGS